MAKIKVYELAQEIGVKSAELLALLKNKGIEVKKPHECIRRRTGRRCKEDIESTCQVRRGT